MLRELIRADVAQHLLNGESIPAQSHGECTVLFADLAHFTDLAENLSPVHLVELHNAIFSDIDSLSERNGIEKITVRSRFLALRAGCHCFQGDRDDAVGKARVEWAMPDEQPVEDGTVDHVEQHLEVLLQRDLPLAAASSNMARPASRLERMTWLRKALVNSLSGSAAASVMAIWRPLVVAKAWISDRICPARADRRLVPPSAKMPGSPDIKAAMASSEAFAQCL